MWREEAYIPDCTNRPKPGWKPKILYNGRNMKGSKPDSRTDSSHATSHFAFVGPIGRHVLDTSHPAFVGHSGKHVLDFSKVWIDDGGSVRHYTHDRKAFKTFSSFEGTMCVEKYLEVPRMGEPLLQPGLQH